MAPPQETIAANTLFVRGLGPGATSDALEAHFSGIGPVRRCFVVTGAGDRTACKGFGFVHYAALEDAARAVTELQGSLLQGRKVKLELAKRRLRGKAGVGEEATEGTAFDAEKAVVGTPVSEKKFNKTREAVVKKVPGALSGSLAMRTVVVRSRVKGSVVDEAGVRAAIGGEGFESCALVANGLEVRCVFRSWPLAGKAAARAHGDVYDAFIDALRGGKKSRLIVRNLPFVVSLKELRTVFGGIASVRELRLSEPKASHPSLERRSGPADDDMKPCAGFCFVEYFLAADAKFAEGKLNGSKIGGRVVAVDMAVSKSSYVAHEDEEVEDEPPAVGMDTKKVSTEAGSFEKEGANESENGSENGSDSDSGSDEESGEDTADTDTPMRDSQNLDNRGTGKPKRASKSTSEEMTRTVFVRNLLFETSSKELWAAMVDRFGPIEQAVLVMHPISGRPRGTAFVRFVEESDANEAVEVAGGGDTSQRKSALLNDQHGGGFQLQGRQLLITKAIDRDRARELVVESDPKSKKKGDPRNLRLAWIGHIKPNTPEANGLSQGDLAKRTKAEKDKKAKLSHNPNSFVSEVRLSVRNLPRDVDEKILKHLFLCAVSPHTSKQGQDAATKKTKPDEAPRVVHSKIVRDTERKAAGKNLAGLDRSKGYGFVQFEKHQDALRALERINNNPKAIEILIKAKPKALDIDTQRERLLRKQWGNDRRLIVEFSVEDKRQVRIIEGIKERGRQKASAYAAEKAAQASQDHVAARNVRDMSDDDVVPEKPQQETRRLSKSERKSELKRKRLHEVEKAARLQTKNAKLAERKERKAENAIAKSVHGATGKVGGVRPVGARGSHQYGSQRTRRDDLSGVVGTGAGTSENTTDRRDAKPKKPRRKRSAADAESDGKLDAMVESYRRKLAKTSTAAAPRWFS